MAGRLSRGWPAGSVDCAADVLGQGAGANGHRGDCRDYRRAGWARDDLSLSAQTLAQLRQYFRLHVPDHGSFVHAFLDARVLLAHLGMGHSEVRLL